MAAMRFEKKAPSFQQRPNKRKLYTSSKYLVSSTTKKQHMSPFLAQLLRRVILKKK